MVPKAIYTGPTIRNSQSKDLASPDVLTNLPKTDAQYSVDSIKRTVLSNVLSLLSVLFSTVIFKKISIKNTVYQSVTG